MRKLASLFPLGMRRRFLAAHLSRIIGDKISGRVRIMDQGWPDGGRLCIGLERNDRDIWLSVNPGALASRYGYRVVYARMPAALRVFAGTRPSVRRVFAEISDGIEVAPGALCFCSSRDDVLLIPDVYFINSDGFQWARKAAKTAPAWSERDDLIVWRGSATGIGALADDRMEAANDRLKQRVRLCLMLRNASGVDARIVKIVRRAKGGERKRLLEHRLVGRRIRERTWARRKFAIDIDGNTNSWSNFYVRLLLGCCVIKIASPSGFRQWYYAALQPWVHYVPVQADMADLFEKIEWCRAHTEECRAIAEAGQAFALSRTVETEIADAIARVEAAMT